MMTIRNSNSGIYNAGGEAWSHAKPAPEYRPRPQPGDYIVGEYRNINNWGCLWISAQDAAEMTAQEKQTVVRDFVHGWERQRWAARMIVELEAQGEIMDENTWMVGGKLLNLYAICGLGTITNNLASIRARIARINEIEWDLISFEDFSLGRGGAIPLDEKMKPLLGGSWR